MSCKIIILLGAPGVGKGSQAAALCRETELTHLSTGEVLRDEIARRTELGRRVKAVVDRGDFVDDDTVLAIVVRRLASADLGDGVVLDGVPRTLEQARRLDTLLADRSMGVHRVLLLSASEETLLERLGGRRVCAECGATYHRVFRPPARSGVCDRCGGKVGARKDDDPKKHRQRLADYRRLTEPLIEYYRHQKLFQEVDASGAPDEVAARIRDALALH